MRHEHRLQMGKLRQKGTRAACKVSSRCPGSCPLRRHPKQTHNDQHCGRLCIIFNYTFGLLSRFEALQEQDLVLLVCWAPSESSSQDSLTAPPTWGRRLRGPQLSLWKGRVQTSWGSPATALGRGAMRNHTPLQCHQGRHSQAPSDRSDVKSSGAAGCGLRTQHSLHVFQTV